MKVLIIIEKSPKQHFLVHLNTKKLAKEVRDLVRTGKRSQAITTAFTKGRFEREVAHHELPHLEADLIISEKTVHWDLIG